MALQKTGSDLTPWDPIPVEELSFLGMLTPSLGWVIHLGQMGYKRGKYEGCVEATRGHGDIHHGHGGEKAIQKAV